MRALRTAESGNPRGAAAQRQNRRGQGRVATQNQLFIPCPDSASAHGHRAVLTRQSELARTAQADTGVATPTLVLGPCGRDVDSLPRDAPPPITGFAAHVNPPQDNAGAFLLVAVHLRARCLPTPLKKLADPWVSSTSLPVPSVQPHSCFHVHSDTNEVGEIEAAVTSKLHAQAESDRKSK